MFSAGNANPPLAAKCLRWAVCLLLIQSLLLLVFPNMLVSALLLAATMILMILAAWFDRQYILWLPLAALISEIQLFLPDSQWCPADFLLHSAHREPGVPVCGKENSRHHPAV